MNAVAPGPVWAPLIPATMSQEKVKKFGKDTAFGRPAQPVEVAPLFVFLASNETRYVTRGVYGVTGGRVLFDLGNFPASLFSVLVDLAGLEPATFRV